MKRTKYLSIRCDLINVLYEWSITWLALAQSYTLLNWPTPQYLIKGCNCLLEQSSLMHWCCGFHGFQWFQTAPLSKYKTFSVALLPQSLNGGCFSFSDTAWFAKCFWHFRYYFRFPVSAVLLIFILSASPDPSQFHFFVIIKRSIYICSCWILISFQPTRF